MINFAKPIEEIITEDSIHLIRLKNDELLVAYVMESESDKNQMYLVYPCRLIISMENEEYSISMYDWMPSIVTVDEGFPIAPNDILTTAALLPDIKTSYINWVTNAKRRMANILAESSAIDLLKKAGKPKLNPKKRKNLQALKDYLDPNIKAKVDSGNVIIPPKSTKTN